MTLEEYHPKSEKFSSHEDWQKFLIIHFNEENTCSLIDTKKGLRLGLLRKIENDPKIVKYKDCDDVEYIAEVWDTANTRKKANEQLIRALNFCLNIYERKAENENIPIPIETPEDSDSSNMSWPQTPPPPWHSEGGKGHAERRLTSLQKKLNKIRSRAVDVILSKQNLNKDTLDEILRRYEEKVAKRVTADD